MNKHSLIIFCGFESILLSHFNADDQKKFETPLSSFTFFSFKLFCLYYTCVTLFNHCVVASLNFSVFWTQIGCISNWRNETCSSLGMNSIILLTILMVSRHYLINKQFLTVCCLEGTLYTILIAFFQNEKKLSFRCEKKTHKKSSNRS